MLLQCAPYKFTVYYFDIKEETYWTYPSFNIKPKA